MIRGQNNNERLIIVLVYTQLLSAEFINILISVVYCCSFSTVSVEIICSFVTVCICVNIITYQVTVITISLLLSLSFSQVRKQYILFSCITLKIKQCVQLRPLIHIDCIARFL